LTVSRLPLGCRAFIERTNICYAFWVMCTYNESMEVGLGRVKLLSASVKRCSA